MDLEKAHHFASMGTFLLTAVLVVLTVLLLLSDKPSSPPGGHVMTVWIMPSLLAVSLIVAGVLHLRAAKVARNNDTVQPAMSDAAAVAGLESRKAQLEGEVAELKLSLSEKQAAAQRQADIISEMQRKSAAQEEIRATTWNLKASAREIKRRWPSADFLDRPAHKSLWVTERARPTRSDIDDRGWLDSAIHWHERLSASDVVKGFDSERLKSLDFDEIIEFLDLYEVEHAGYNLSIPFKAAPANSPCAAIVRFDVQNRLFGAVLMNHSDIAALEIRIAPFRIGKYRLSFANSLNTLTKEHGEKFVQAVIVSPDGPRLGVSIFDLVRERSLCIDDGFVPINIRTTYKDSSGKRYGYRHELVQHVTDRDSQFTSVLLRGAELYD